MSKRFVSLFVALVFNLSLFAQEDNTNQAVFIEAEYFLLNEDYSDALNGYLQLYEKLPDNANLAYCIGVCYLNIQGKKNLSVSYLETASKNMSAKHKDGTLNQLSAPYDALYYLATAYRINYKFDKAKEAFLKYSGTLLPDDHENQDFIKHEIEVCDMAKNLIAKPVSFSQENAGEIFNDDKPNFNPIISADGKSFAYMVSLKFYDAIMFSKLINGKWSVPVNITPELQSDGDFYISCLSADGKMIFLSKDDNYNSDIYFSSLNGGSWAKTVKLNKNINTKYWESHGYISDDGEELVFASDRPGGFGGLDLYISHKVNGDWGPAVNLGPEINTQFNEDRPFLINKAKTLFFSSQGHDNIGGYDLFRSEIQSNGLWSKPANLGYPLNTPDDNIFFMPIGDGKSGYYSNMKELTGNGKEDIYKITFR
ncbi:MAG: PD40 domain-containing protein [Bacteroidales bacterium]|nr:PD40 domain-containing protein [Bacteroidales bacterium]